MPTRCVFNVIWDDAAVALCASRPGNPFQNHRWVRAVAAARARAHRFVAVQAQRDAASPAYLFGGLHRRAGFSVFEAMPMGAYGRWLSEAPLLAHEERTLTEQCLRWVPWAVVRLTSEPGRAADLPLAGSWPLPAGLRQRLAGRDFETHVLDLTADDDARLKRVKPNVRSYLRRVDTLGYRFQLGGPGALADFCDWYRRGSQGWEGIASALMPDSFFEALQCEGGMDIWRVDHDGKAVGAAAFLLGRDQVQYQASGTAKVAGPVSAMDALLWVAARHYRERGMHSMNLGASEGLSGVRRFKEKFGAVAFAYRCETYLLPRVRGRLLAQRNTGRPA